MQSFTEMVKIYSYRTAATKTCDYEVIFMKQYVLSYSNQPLKVTLYKVFNCSQKTTATFVELSTYIQYVIKL